MTEPPAAPEPIQDPPPTTPDVEPTPARVRPRARDIGLGAIAFAATLVLLLGATGLFDRDGSTADRSGGGSSSASPAGGSASSAAVPSDSGGQAAPTSSLAPGQSELASPSPGTLPSESPTGDPVLVGAGDIADCGSVGDEDTATLLDEIEGTVFTAGDNVYEDGSADDFRDCYQPSWGRHRDRTRPAPGNHDWGTRGLAGYRGYFGDAAAGPGSASWYSYELGSWHVLVLDSECDEVDGCGPTSPQGAWLAADLAASQATCTIAIFHKPRFSSGDEHGNDPDMDAFWRPLYAAGVDVIVNGHDHDYERFAPQDPDGREDRVNGIRQFVVGTGGRALRGFDTPVPNSELRSADFHGVIAFTLHDRWYDWQFTAVGSPFRDRGTAHCH